MHTDSYQSRYKADYAKLMKLLRRKRITIRSFVRKANISPADFYMIKIGELMSVEGEYNACTFLGCDSADIRDLVPRDSAFPPDSSKQ